MKSRRIESLASLISAISTTFGYIRTYSGTTSAPPASQHQTVDVAAEVAALVERRLTEKFALVEGLLEHIVGVLVH